MKRCGIILAALVIVGTFFASGAQAAATVQWTPYPQALPLAKKENRPVFLHFFADWCRYCEEMEETTFKDPAVVDRLNNEFVSVKVNVDENSELAGNYSVRGLPMTWFLSPDSGRIGGRPGYISAKEMLKILEYVQSGEYKKDKGK